MRRFLIPIFASLIFACSGSHHTAAPTPPAPPVATPVARGVYTAKIHTTASAAILGAVQPIGDITQTMVVDPYSASILELPGWNMINAVLTALPDGTIQLGVTPAFLTADGTLSTLTLTGGSVIGNEMTGTVNNGLTFDVVLTATQNNPIDMSTKAGKWISTASNTGQVLVLTIPSAPRSDGNTFSLAAAAYATNADALAGTNVVSTYTGSMYWSQGDPTHLLNFFDIGWAMDGTPGDGTPGGGGGGNGFVGGVAYFDTNGNMVMFTGRGLDNGQNWNKQLSAVFTKQ